LDIFFVGTSPRYFDVYWDVLKMYPNGYLLFIFYGILAPLFGKDAQFGMRFGSPQGKIKQSTANKPTTKPTVDKQDNQTLRCP